MKNKNYSFIQLKLLGEFLSKLVTVIVMGLPRKEMIYKPENKSLILGRKQTFQKKYKKYYHRPISRPSVEKQTLLKEKKKLKSVY